MMGQRGWWRKPRGGTGTLISTTTTGSLRVISAQADPISQPQATNEGDGVKSKAKEFPILSASLRLPLQIRRYK